MKLIIIFLFFALTQISYSQWVLCKNGLRQPNISAPPYLNVVAASGDYLFAGTEDDCMYISTDNGDNWTKKSSVPYSTATIFSIAVTENTIFYGSKGLFYSTDSGENWITVAGFDTVWVYSLFASGDSILAGTHCGVFFSTNNGSDWQKISSYYSQAVAIVGNYILIGTQGYNKEEPIGLFVSINGGVSWIEDSVFNDLAISSIFIKGNEIYTAWAGNSGVGLQYSTNYGNSWSNIYSSPYASWDCIYAIDNKIFIGKPNHIVYFSPDNGNSWKSISDGLNAGDGPRRLWDFAVKDNYIFAATYQGVYRALLDDFTSVENGGTEQDYNIFPNPARNIARLKLPEGGAPLEASFFIYNPLGVKVKEIKYSVSDARQFVEFDVSALPPGIYFLTLRTEGGAVTRQFAVVR